MSKKILIADDEVDFVMFLRRKLESRGFEVEETFRGSDVVDRIENNSIDLLLLDYAMPDMRGDVVCENIKDKASLKNFPIIIITANNHIDVNVFTDMGVTDILYKPLDDDLLLEKIEKFLK